MPTPTITNKSADVQNLKKINTYLCPDYSPDEKLYLQRLQSELEMARNARDTNHDEFDGMTFVESWQAEEKAANTFVLPKINQNDNNFQSGIVRDSLIDLVAQVANMDMSPDIHAYDENNFEVSGMGMAMETILDKYDYLDNDDEKRIDRAFELFKHGYCFNEEIWRERWGWMKDWVNKFDGTIGTAKWTKKMRKLYARPERNILSGLLVYLGNISEKDFNKQSLVFTVKYRDYDEWASEYMRKDRNGKLIWERAEFVTKTRQDIASYLGPQIVYNTWRLTEVIQNQVEEVRVQKPFSNEYALICSGVLMTPMGIPLPWGYDGCNIVQQNLEPIHPFFAYGKSLVSRMRVNTAIYDELKKVAVLKTQKSLFPPRLNMTGQSVSRRMFMPGVITNANFSGQQIPVIDEKDASGVSASEFQMIQEIEQNIRSKTMMPASGSGKMTNQQISQQQQAAQVAVGWFMFYDCMMEQKLDWLRLFNVMENHFDPTDKDLDTATQQVKKTYRITNVPSMIPGKGMGNRVIVPTDEDVSKQNIDDHEDTLQKATGKPHQIIVLKPSELMKTKWIWQISVLPKQKKTSDTSKVMFRGMMQDIEAFGNDVNMQYLEEEFAMVWGKDPSKLFHQSNQGGGQPGQNTAQNKQIPGMPTPQKGMAQSMSNQITPNQ